MDIVRSNRAKIAVRLNKFPCEVDTQPARDIWDILGVFDDEAQRSKR